VPLLDDIPEAAQHTNGDAPVIQLPTDPASFQARVADTRVDLLARILDGIPEIEYLPGSEGMLIRGKRHQIAAPKKEGKSISKLVHWVTMALQGARVTILDRENGANLYASRLDAILDGFELAATDRERVNNGIAYYEFPRLRKLDGPDLAAHFKASDVVVFDSQRMFLTDLGLGEDGSDDYATFMGAAVDPLFQAGIATVILDNTGHEETRRARGSSTKGDLNEILFTLQALQQFDLHRVGRVRLEITDSRFGTTGRWEMTIGGGIFGPWERTSEAATTSTGDEFRPTIYMERVSRYLEHQAEPVSLTAVEGTVVGHAKYVRVALDSLVLEQYVSERKGARNARLFTSIRPFRHVDPVHTPSTLDGFDPVHDPDQDIPF